MFRITQSSGGRLLVGGALIVLTAGVLIVFGLTTTSAIIEVAVFAAGIAAWIIFGERREGSKPSHLHAKRLRSRHGSVKIDHEGNGSVSVRDVDADQDIGIRHRPDR